ncbi:GEVED domain-containing protein [Chryseobacterium sp. KACC 21268]|nr:GEVED domain-containing protein [Chryseobacterium sp. KACC 21268]
MAIGANAQITVNESFEASTSLPTGWTSTGGYSDTSGSTNGVYTGVTCDGNQGLGAEMYGATNGGRTLTIVYTSNPSTSNAKKIDYSFKWFADPYSTGDGVTGTITVSYSRVTGNTYTTLGTTAINAQTGCQTISGTIPESTSATTGVPANAPFKFRVVVTTTNNTALQNDFYWFIDGVKLMQETTVAPSCTTVTLPTTGANPNNNNSITWGTVGGASSYKVYLGTSAGNYDIVNGTAVVNSPYSLTGLLSANTTYFAKVVPTNAIGDATGCTESSFTTGAADYCTVKSNSDNRLDYISNVSYEGITNTTTAGTAASGPSYFDYTAQKATVKIGEAKTLSVTLAADPGYPTDYLTAYIDWNQDKSFSASEKYVLASYTGSGTYTANVSVPADAILGDTRLRVIAEYNGSSTYVPTACNNSYGYGEVEDYTVTVQEATLAVSDVDKGKISVYPNPFTDVLKISDVKGVKSVSVTDVSGREVKSLAPSAELNLSSLKTGLYIVNLKMEDGSVKTFKAIKK